ncbi:MAG: hypothetical protein IJ039_06455 [Clostridia bacterium]|nr:hypothetical protein [Clostridia bacterium]
MAKKELKSELQDLSRVLQEVAVDKVGCFYKYRDKKDIGKKIYNAIMKKYDKDGGVFQFSDELPEAGLLSQLQGFASVVSLLEGFGLKLDSESKNKTTKAFAEKAKAFIDDMIDDMLNRIYVDGRIKIGASPYNLNAVFDEYDYIDSVTWVMSAILGVMRLHIKGDYIIDFESDKGQKIIKLYKHCLKYLLDSYIDNPSSKRKFNCGWNFTKDCEEPSLYFTFAVSELLIDILTTFEDVIRVADIDLIKEIIVKEHDKNGFLQTDRYKFKQDKINQALAEAEQDTSFEGYGEALEEFYDFTDEEKELIKAVYSKIGFLEKEYADNKKRILDGTNKETQRQKELFKLINNVDKDEENLRDAVYSDESPYKKFEDICKKSANQIWELTSEGLASEFYSSNLESKITEEIIANSVSSDAVFNVIFAINILINAGIDEDYDDKINYFATNDEEKNQATSDYDNMRDTIRLAYDNCYQYLMKLKKENKEYKIVEYNLNFEESFVKHAKIIKEIRKEHIRVFSLMPLMVRTKTTIGEFLIKYPQYDMMIYLEHILAYRCSENDSYLWIWENDGYSTSSNYYFISAFAAFYDYYDKYESVFHETVEGNKQAKTKIENDFHKRLQEEGIAVDKTIEQFIALEKEIEKQRSEISALSTEIERLENDPLRKVLSGFIEEILQKTIISVLTTKLSEEASRIVADASDRVKRFAEENAGDDAIEPEEWDAFKLEKEKRERRERKAEGREQDEPKVESFENSMRQIILAALTAEPLGEAIYSAKPNKKERYDKLDQLSDSLSRLDKDTKSAVRYYAGAIAQGKDSYFVANKGESTLPTTVMHQMLISLLENKITKGDQE